MSSTIFNPTQQHLLMMFAYDSSEENLREVKECLTRHFAQKVEERFNELWDAGILDQNKLDELRNMHLHTDLAR